MGDHIQTSLDWTFRICPNCQSAKVNPKRNYSTSSPAERFSFNQVKEQFVGLNNGTRFFTYVRCGNCNQMYCPIYFSESQLADCYREMPDNLMGAERRTARINQEGYAKQILAELNYQPKSYLEIGPDVGLLANALQSTSKFKSVYLVEPNQMVHSQLRESLEAESLKEIVSNLSESAATNIDLCVGIHILDHLLNPRNELATLRHNLNSSGRLVFVIHNEKSILRRILKGKWPPFCLQHPQLFNRSSVRKLLLGSGFEVIKIRRTKNYVRMDNVVNNFLEVLRWNFKLPKSKYWPTLRLYFGNIIVICKRVD